MGSESNIAQIIIAVATLVTAAAAAVIGIINAMRITAVTGNVQKIEIATNSMKDQLVASTAKASLAEGTAVGLEQGRDENRPGNVLDGSEGKKPVKVEVVNTPLLTQPGKDKGNA